MLILEVWIHRAMKYHLPLGWEEGVGGDAGMHAYSHTAGGRGWHTGQHAYLITLQVSLSRHPKHMLFQVPTGRVEDGFAAVLVSYGILEATGECEQVKHEGAYHRCCAVIPSNRKDIYTVRRLIIKKNIKNIKKKKARNRMRSMHRHHLCVNRYYLRRRQYTFYKNTYKQKTLFSWSGCRWWGWAVGVGHEE